MERNNKIEGPIAEEVMKDFLKIIKILINYSWTFRKSSWIKDNEKNQVQISIESLTKANQIFLERYFVKSNKHPNLTVFNNNKIKE